MKTYFLAIIILILGACQHKGNEENKSEKISYLQTTLLTNSDLYQKKPNELRLMRNEIYARNGYIFKNRELRKHFEGKDWYQPLYENVDHLLSDMEKQNIQLILNWEKSLRKNEERQEVIVTQNSKDYNTNAYEIDYKRRIVIDNYYITLFAVHTTQKSDISELSYHDDLIGYFIASTDTLLSSYAKKGQSFESLVKRLRSFVTIDDSCSPALIYSNLEIVEFPIFSDGSKTLRYKNQGCDNYYDYIYVEVKNGELSEKFSVRSWGNVNDAYFYQINDTLFYTTTTDRDEIVSNFQQDYKYVYNRYTDELTFIKPDLQVIDWTSYAMDNFDVYFTKESAKELRLENIKFSVNAGDEIYLDSLFRKLGVIKVIVNGDSSGYVNTGDIQHGVISDYAAG